MSEKGAASEKGGKGAVSGPGVSHFIAIAHLNRGPHLRQQASETRAHLQPNTRAH